MAASSLALQLRSTARVLLHRRGCLQHQARGFASIKAPSSIFAALDAFPERHIGPDDKEATFMLQKLGYRSMDEFIAATVPPKIRLATASINNESMPAFSEAQMLARAKALGSRNSGYKSYIGMGYHNAVVPPVILRNVSIPSSRPCSVLAQRSDR